MNSLPIILACFRLAITLVVCFTVCRVSRGCTEHDKGYNAARAEVARYQWMDEQRRKAMKMICPNWDGKGTCKLEPRMSCPHATPHEAKGHCNTPVTGRCNCICIPYVEKPAESVKCPACWGRVEVFAHNVHQRAKCVDCEMAGPIAETPESALAAFKRIRMEPEPVKCPRCGNGVEFALVQNVNKYGGPLQHAGFCRSCGINGPACYVRSEAESEFRKLRYEGGAK